MGFSPKNMVILHVLERNKKPKEYLPYVYNEDYYFSNEKGEVLGVLDEGRFSRWADNKGVYKTQRKCFIDYKEKVFVTNKNEKNAVREVDINFYGLLKQWGEKVFNTSLSYNRLSNPLLVIEEEKLKIKKLKDTLARARKTKLGKKMLYLPGSLSETYDYQDLKWHKARLKTYEQISRSLRLIADILGNKKNRVRETIFCTDFWRKIVNTEDKGFNIFSFLSFILLYLPAEYLLHKEINGEKRENIKNYLHTAYNFSNIFGPCYLTFDKKLLKNAYKFYLEPNVDKKLLASSAEMLASSNDIYKAQAGNNILNIIGGKISYEESYEESGEEFDETSQKKSYKVVTDYPKLNAKFCDPIEYYALVTKREFEYFKKTNPKEFFFIKTKGKKIIKYKMVEKEVYEKWCDKHYPEKKEIYKLPQNKIEEYLKNRQNEQIEYFKREEQNELPGEFRLNAYHVVLSNCFDYSQVFVKLSRNIDKIRDSENYQKLIMYIIRYLSFIGITQSDELSDKMENNGFYKLMTEGAEPKSQPLKDNLPIVEKIRALTRIEDDTLE